MKGFALSLRTMSWLEIILMLLVATGFALFVWLTWRERRSSFRRMVLTGLRVAATGLMAAAFLQPSVKRSVKMSDAPVAVVLDRSESMAVADAGTKGDTPRWKAATDWMARVAPVLHRDASPRYYLLDKKIKSADPADIAKVVPRGEASQLALLESIPQENPDVRAILLLTDGRQSPGRQTGATPPIRQTGTTAGADGGVDGGGDLISVSARLGIPLIPVGVGRALSAPDLILDSVRAPHFAFKNTDVEVTARVEKRNLPLANVTVEVLDEGRPVASGVARFAPGSDTAEVVVHLKPSEKGLRTYQARVPVFVSESNGRNNSRSFSLDVSRDRVRVLYITGRPGPHYAFLREQLKSNPSVDLVSFVILRDPEDVVNFSEQELSLIPFPTQDVLFQQIKTFDMIIFEQFAFSQFGIAPAHLAVLKEYVEKGGGLLLIGDSSIIGPTSPYRHTPIEDLLPVALGDLVSVPEQVSAEVPEAGHPVMALEDDVSASAAAWRGMPPLTVGGQLPARAKPQALVLAQAQGPGGRLPILTVWPRGKGRVMTFSSLNSWQWALGESGRGHGTWAYQRFWNNLLRWMSASEDFRLVRLDLPREPSESGVEVWLRAFVRDENYQPLATGDVIATVTSPSGKSVRRTLRALGKGEYADNLALEEIGAYRVSIQAYSRQKRIGEDQGQMRVGLPWDENRDTSTDFALLSKAAQAGGGEFVLLENASPEWLEKNLNSISYAEEKSAAPWNAPVVLILLAVALLAEWTFRRRWGAA